MIFYNLFLLITTHAVMNSAEVTEGDVKKFAVANNILAGRLYNRLIDGNTDNVVFCPASLTTGLGVVAAGARGKTQNEIYRVLGYRAACLHDSKIPETFKYVFTKQLPQNDPSTENYTLSCADAALAAAKAKLNCTYKKEVQKKYLTTVKNVDFTSNPEDVARMINYLVAQRTNGEIDNVVKDVKPDTSYLAINAVYFRGHFNLPFPPKSRKRRMFHAPEEDKSAPFVHVSGPFPYTETIDYQAVFLPYVGENAGLLVLLPREQDGLSTLEKTITPDIIVNTVNQLKVRSVNVTLPVTNIEFARNFADDFKALGAPSVYDKSGDFSGITDEKNFALSGPVHKALFVIDEGDEDECNQRVYIPPAHSYEFTADHPFMFAVVDKRDGMLLFVGRVIHLYNSPI